MIGYTPSKALKPGMRVQVTELGSRAVTPDAEGMQVWTVKFACPARFGGKAGTEITFENGAESVFPANVNWIVESV